MRRLSKPLIAGGRGRGKSCEFVLHVDLSETDKECTMKCASAPQPYPDPTLSSRAYQLSLQHARIGEAEAYHHSPLRIACHHLP